MMPETFFLDTNIFLGAALEPPVEPNYDACRKVFVSSIKKRTSKTVLEELHNRLKKRKRLYSKMVIQVVSGKDLYDLEIDDLNKSDYEHFRDLVTAFNMKNQDLAFIRALERVVARRISEALDGLELPYIQKARNDQFQDALITRQGISPEDARIIDDFITWAMGNHANTWFLTMDRKILDSNKDLMVDDFKLTVHDGTCQLDFKHPKKIDWETV